MKFKMHLLLLASCMLAAPPLVRAATPQKKDYLSSVEADKIRDAETVNERIKLFLTYADDRLKNFSMSWTIPLRTGTPTC